MLRRCLLYDYQIYFPTILDQLQGQTSGGHPLKGTLSREKSFFSKKNDFPSLNMLDEITTVLPLQ